MTTVNLYTDGACSGNQSATNAGGWGAILESGGKTKDLCGGEANTTNNRMELTGLLEGLRALKRMNITLNVYSDSAYIVNCFHQKWYVNWQRNGWKNSKKDPVENRDLWEAILDLADQVADIHFFKVKGHLDINKAADVRKWKAKFEKAYGPISDQAFAYLTEMNHRVDALANEGMAPHKK